MKKMKIKILESQETSIRNEFLFSFLITKFYINNENKIPNCFENYLSKFGILNIFNMKIYLYLK